jgi:pSer/pThr/pTyr-binding forkhead associated (FHA) protein
MEVQLVMFTEAGERREFDLKRTVSIIGRAGDCDFQIPLPMISRRHCQITRKSDRVLVKDLGSSNGSYINNKRVLQAEVHGGDILTVGPVVFTILIDGKPTDIKAIPSIVKPAAEPSGRPGGGGRGGW